MTRIEGRDGAFSGHVEAVLWERDAAYSAIDAVRRVVNRLRQCVAGGKIQAAREPLPEKRLQGVVIGVGRSLQIVDERKLRELRVERPARLARRRQPGRRLIDVTQAE